MPTDWRTPTMEEALLFAQLLEVCIPAEAAIGVVDPELAEEVRPELARQWTKDRRVKAARFDYRDWRTRSVEGRMDYALQRTYNGMAIYLAVHNIGELETAQLTKANTFRDAIEKKLAGTAGRGDATSRFFEDVLAGKIKLQPEAIQ